MTQISTRSPFGDLLRFYRGKTVDRDVGKPLSQEKLAYRISDQIGWTITRNIVSNWENGKSDLHPQKDRLLLIAIVSTLYRYRGIETLEEANHLLEAGDYRALDEREISSINPQWIPTLRMRKSTQDIKSEISTLSASHRSVKVRSPITLNIETKESMPIVVHTPKSNPKTDDSPHSLFIGRESDQIKSIDNPSISLLDKSKVTIQILIAINA
jgi:transcriptional regulator with XRE-family HTH domain